jgi:hypothetical protein
LCGRIVDQHVGIMVRRAGRRLRHDVGLASRLSR